MKTAHRRSALLLLVALTAVPMFGAIASEATLPVGGYLELPNDLSYRTEILVTNHRDAEQHVSLNFVADGSDTLISSMILKPHETRFQAAIGNTNPATRRKGVVAIRVAAVIQLPEEDFRFIPDPAGRIEVSSFIVADRGNFGFRGSSRQEVTGIPSTDYRVEEMVFLGVRHENPTYTNVGITNLHKTQTEKFYVQYQFLDPIEVIVPPLSSRQIRIPGAGNGGRRLTVYPEWAIGDGPPARTTPWVAYASTVDGYTGDAFSGTRVPATSKINQ